MLRLKYLWYEKFLLTGFEKADTYQCYMQRYGMP